MMYTHTHTGAHAHIYLCMSPCFKKKKKNTERSRAPSRMPNAVTSHKLGWACWFSVALRVQEWVFAASFQMTGGSCSTTWRAGVQGSCELTAAL